MSLSSEDQLRIQVMLHNSPKAVRIDENRMVLYAWTPNGEASIPLSPNLPNEQYLRLLRELLSEHVLGSAGGYPLYLKRWSRMGLSGDQQLEAFLLLGEPEAVVAVASSPGLTTELARLVWWAVSNTAQQAEQGLQMLHRSCVVEDALGREIAQFLMEFLPFEADPEAVLSILSAVLQEGLLGSEQVERIWQRSQERGKGIYQVAFLQARPLALPESAAAHTDLEAWQQQLQPLRNNPLALLLLQLGSSGGQAFLQQSIRLLDTASNEISVYALMNAIGSLFAVLDLPLESENLLEEEVSEKLLEQENCSALLEQTPALRPQVEAMLLLSQVRQEITFKKILHSGSVGRSLRKKLKPEFDLIRTHLQRLQP
ncbi:MAG: sulfur reduction protein DsrS [Gammaproteobacteria bacterium]|jgi:hypothetical protein|nr:sulfur reduction protein DsrS [Gammaproteobacteria bacterium]MBT4606142.1 sulfur reduction protein DsrS [Thiotrichales bacterium]MBT3472014.1 sulfur reduction protein DsrS [Gammaproteobacteria bacterium]MBT3968516.1 sulfur reduction protein DsrS [Gammaproteobacteria bacterium]MBT4079586.1 sulfur reduction protein DsrS [Gammaproteobacteria bacterium]